MFSGVLELRFKKDVLLKDVYEPLSMLFREFIMRNDKQLKERHYIKTFSNYSFGSPYPIPKKLLYKKDKTYFVELRTVCEEFLDLRGYAGMETTDFELVSVNIGKGFYLPQSKLLTETPAFFDTKKIETDEYEQEIKEKIRENIVFRILKSNDAKFQEMNDENFVHVLRKDVIDEITIYRKPIGIPFPNKKNNKGEPIRYFCLHIGISFQDNKLAKEVERYLCFTGIGRMTSNGFGHFRME